jgi:hypothetical protein
MIFCLGNKKRCFIETPSSPSKLLDNPYIHRELTPGSLSPGRPGRGGVLWSVTHRGPAGRTGRWAPAGWFFGLELSATPLGQASPGQPD